jgi:Ca-activated chloride channel family protein
MKRRQSLACVFAAVILAACGSSSPSGDGYAPDSGGWAGTDAGSWSYPDGGAGAPHDGGTGGGNISLGGAQDFGYFRTLLDNNQVPTTEDFDAAGFFAEHYLTLPPPDCGERVCLQAMLGVMPSLLDGESMSMVQLGLNTPVTIDPGTRPPLNLAVVVDVSGSMESAGKIDYVRQGLAQLINSLDDGDRIAIVTYATNALLPFAMQPVGGNRATLLDIAAGLNASGATNLYGGLQLGYQQLQAAYDSDRQNRVILLSDGQPTEGNTDPDAILSMSAGFNSEALAITTIGLGTAFNASLMRGLSEQGHGNHYFLESSDAIDEVFTEELAYFTVPVAFDVTLEAKAGSHYQFLSAHGSSFWLDNADGGRLSVPSVFLAHRVSGNDTTPGTGGTGRRGGGSALLLHLAPIEPTPDPEANNALVADLDVSFRAPGETTLTTANVKMNYPYNATHQIAEGHWIAGDPTIAQKSFVMMNIYLGLERACDRFHTGGDTTDAIAQLMRVKAATEDFEAGLTDGDLDMVADAALVQKLIDVLLANGVAEPADADIPADPWPGN